MRKHGGQLGRGLCFQDGGRTEEALDAEVLLLSVNRGQLGEAGSRGVAGSQFCCEKMALASFV